jgi:hypothetical protein
MNGRGGRVRCVVSVVGLCAVLLVDPADVRAGGRIHLKQGYAIEADNWWEEGGLLWYTKGNTTSAVTRSDVVRIEGNPASGVHPTEPTPSQIGSVEVGSAKYSVTERDPYLWRWSVETSVVNKTDRQARIRVVFTFVNWQGDTLHILGHDVNLAPGESKTVFGTVTTPASVGKEVTNVKTGYSTR